MTVEKKAALVDPIPVEDPLSNDKKSKKPQPNVNEKENELSEEDQQLKDELDLLLQRLKVSLVYIYLATYSIERFLLPFNFCVGGV